MDEMGVWRFEPSHRQLEHDLNYRVIHRAVLARFKRAISVFVKGGPREAGHDEY